MNEIKLNESLDDAKPIKVNRLIKLKYEIHKRAQRLRNNPSKVNVWFQQSWHKHDMMAKVDLFGEVLFPYIVSLVNYDADYVIEIYSPETITKARTYLLNKRIRHYTQKGYSVFLIKAYNEDSLKETIDAVTELRRLKYQHRASNWKEYVKNVTPSYQAKLEASLKSMT